MTRFRWLVSAGFLIACALLPGCTDPIRTYEVPWTKQRLLGAIIFAPDNAWFVKLMGPAAEVETHKGEFESFVRALRFPSEGKDPIVWKLPEGWSQEPGNELRFATFRLGGGLEVTLSKFKGDGGSLLPNVNRWRGQLNLEPVSGKELLEICKREKLAGDIEAMLVDMESARVAPVPDFKPPEPKKSDGPFDYTVPEGWRQKASAGPIAVVAFSIVDQAESAEVTVTPLAGGGGAIEANINRWRGQIDLPPADAEQLRKDSKVIKVDGQDSIFVELIGPNRKSILACICAGDQQTWFIKMMGDAGVVAKNKTALEAFLGSVRFRGGK